LVASGIYSVVVEVTDNFGKLTTWSESLTVLRSDLSTEVQVYNSAGEMVWHAQKLPQAPGLVGVSSREIIPDPSGPGLKISYGSGSSDYLMWDGTGSGGQALSSGTYMVKITQSGTDGKSTSTFAVTLLQPNAQVFAWVAAAPNPATPGVSSIMISLQGAAPGISAWGEAYNLSGEHVGTLNLVSGPNLRWDIPSGLASGVYILQISARDSQGRLKTAPVKIAIVR
jgi:hypothetical protein